MLAVASITNALPNPAPEPEAQRPLIGDSAKKKNEKRQLAVFPQLLNQGILPGLQPQLLNAAINPGVIAASPPITVLGNNLGGIPQNILPRQVIIPANPNILGANLPGALGIAPNLGLGLGFQNPLLGNLNLGLQPGIQFLPGNNILLQQNPLGGLGLGRNLLNPGLNVVAANDPRFFNNAGIAPNNLPNRNVFQRDNRNNRVNN